MAHVARRAARADAAPAARRGCRLSGARRIARRADAARVRRRDRRAHDRAEPAHRRRARRAARAVRAARRRDAWRRTPARVGRRAGAGRSGVDRRRRARAGRRLARRRARAERRRIAAHGRIRARRQGCRAARRADARRSRVPRPFRLDGRARAGTDDRHRHRAAHCARPDRQVADGHRGDAVAAAARRAHAREPDRARRARAVRGARHRLSLALGRMAAGRARGDHARDGHLSRGDSGRDDRVHGARRAPHRRRGHARAPHERDRGARADLGAVRRQDGHAHAEPDDGAHAVRERPPLDARRRSGRHRRVVSRAARIPGARERDRARRSDGARVPARGQPLPRGHRAPARRLVARAGIRADARAAGDVARVARAAARPLPGCVQGRARGDFLAVPSR